MECNISTLKLKPTESEGSAIESLCFKVVCVESVSCVFNELSGQRRTTFYFQQTEVKIGQKPSYVYPPPPGERMTTPDDTASQPITEEVQCFVLRTSAVIDPN